MNIGYKIIIEDVGKNSEGIVLTRMVLQMFVDGQLVATKGIAVDDSEKIKDVVDGRLKFKELKQN